MKTVKVFELSEIPQEFHKKILDKHYIGNVSYCPGDGYFKPQTEVRNWDNVLRYHFEGDNPDTEYVYEIGDDPLGDWFMEQGIKLCEEIEIDRD